MKILVCGGRDFGEGKDIENAIEKTIYRVAVRLWMFGVLDTMWKMSGPFELVHGACPTGADNLADMWASKRNVVVHRHPAQWATYGKRAGPIRNGEMLKAHQIDLVLAFFGGAGTDNMVKLAELEGIKVVRFGKGNASGNLSLDPQTDP